MAALSGQVVFRKFLREGAHKESFAPTDKVMRMSKRGKHVTG
jgi:hypothetical protein